MTCRAARDSVTGRGNMLASTTGAATRPSQAGSLAEDEATVLTFSGFQDETSRPVTTDGSDNVVHMVFDQSFRDADDLRELPRSAERLRDELHNALPDGEVWG